MPQVLREYQAKAVDALRAVFRKGVKSCVLVSPTGSGKTTISSAIIFSAIAKKQHVVFLAHRKELIDQCSVRLDEQGVDHGIIKAGNRRVNRRPVQIASLQTLINRIRPKENELMPAWIPPADIFIIDEAHRARAKTYEEILTYYPKTILLGLTATPARLDGKGLGELFDEMVMVANPQELIDMGFLVPARVFTTPMTPDFSRVKMSKGDFDQAAVEEKVDKPKIVGDLYTHWKKHAADRQTVIFAVSRHHAHTICGEFESYGEKIEYLDGETPTLLRDAILKRVALQQTQIVVNVGILTEGWDNAEISCVVLARPTKSLTLYLQMSGRGLRPASWIRKADCIILDHGGNCARHGFVSDDREWDLSGKKNGKVDVKGIKTCPQCFAVYPPHLKSCPNCKLERAPGTRDNPVFEHGTLLEVKPGELRGIEIAFMQEHYDMMIRGRLDARWPLQEFLKRFGRWPGAEVGVIKKNWTERKQPDGTVKVTLANWEFRPPRKSSHPAAKVLQT